MEDWQIDFEWLKVRHYIKDALHRKDLPDLQSILFLIGIQEFGRWDVDKQFTKEEKQDLMHIGVCTLLEEDGYCKFVGKDHDGWPHWEEVKGFKIKGIDEQEQYLKQKVIAYFKIENDHNNLENTRSHS